MKNILTRIRAHIFEYLENRDAFIEEFDSLLAKRDTSDVWRKLAIWMLVDKDHGVLKFTKPCNHRYRAIQRVAQLYIDDCKDREEFINAHLYAVAAAFDDDEDDSHCASYHAALVAVYIASYKVAPDVLYHYDYYAIESFAAAGSAAFYRNHHFTVAYPAMAKKLIELIKKSPEAT